jgi:hypothetical protein
MDAELAGEYHRVATNGNQRKQDGRRENLPNQERTGPGNKRRVVDAEDEKTQVATWVSWLMRGDTPKSGAITASFFGS